MAFIILFILLAVASAAFLLWRERLLRNIYELSICIILLTLLMDLRLYFLPYATLDYKDFLQKWIDFFRVAGGFKGLRYSIGNYNVPYLYFLALFSYFPLYDLYLIKLLSVAFDIVLAFSGLKLVSVFTENRLKRLAVFFLILVLPTVVLNGSCWAQCDSIYASFALLGLYFMLKNKPVLSVVMLALSFGFKLQAVFIMPVYLSFLIARRMKVRHLLAFPLTYAALVLPSVIAGRPFWDTVTLYFNQVDTVGDGLNYNAPTIFSFFDIDKSVLAARLGIAAAFIFIIIVYVAVYRSRANITDEVLFSLSLIFSVAVPFFLPHMHDRYFFIADILSLCYAVLRSRRYPVAILVSFASLLGYYAYLMKRYLLTMNFGAVALVIVLFCLLYDLNRMLNGDSQMTGNAR